MARLSKQQPLTSNYPTSLLRTYIVYNLLHLRIDEITLQNTVSFCPLALSDNRTLASLRIQPLQQGCPETGRLSVPSPHNRRDPIGQHVLDPPS